MREVEVTRFVRATPGEIERVLTPTGVVSYEGSFDVADVRDGDEAGVTHVVAGGRGLEMTLRFEETESGLYYTQEGGQGPFAAMETWVSVRARDEGSVVTMRSAVSLGLPVKAVSDRVAAWKRRGELTRALDALADDVE